MQEAVGTALDISRDTMLKFIFILKQTDYSVVK